MWSQIKKARGTWARVGQEVLQVDNTPPKVSVMFYKAVVQLVLLCGIETWNTVWLRNISLGEDQIMCGSTRPPATCSRSVE